MAAASEGPVVLPAVVDLDALEEVRDALLAETERGAVEVSGAAVERISTNALLMLASAAETARRNDFPCTITAASPAMRAMC